MAVVSRENPTALLELRSAALTLIAVVLKTTDLDALAGELEQRASVMPGLFDDEPVAIDLSRMRDEEAPIDFAALLALLRRHRMVPLAVRGGSETQ
ncbi:MAG: septum site-determining protein MinC, partial [Burkholderiaceae bacterium]|nr:septum site-determining protein MinC [Burkholderiaceae bacterium]